MGRYDGEDYPEEHYLRQRIRELEAQAERQRLQREIARSPIKVECSLHTVIPSIVYVELRRGPACVQLQEGQDFVVTKPFGCVELLAPEELLWETARKRRQ